MRFDEAVVTHVGTAPPGYNHSWMTHTVHYHGFPDLSTVRGASVDSPEFMLLGNQWYLELHPGGDEDAVEGMTSICLWNNSNKAIEIDFGFNISDGNGKQVAYKRSNGNFASVEDDDDDMYWGFDFAKRSDLMSSLVNGTLVIEVHMRLAKPTKSVSPPFIPENPLTKMIQEEFLKEKYSDIVIEVVGEEEPKDTSTKVAMAAVTFPAHRVIVMKGLSFLAILCESLGNTTTPIQITGVSHDIFRLLLSYIYGMTISNDNMKLHAKEIINAADKFGVPSLKLEAEARLVEDTVITIENVMDLLVYAECKNCALLKEVAMDFIVDNKAEVIEKLSFADTVPGTLMRDLLVATVRGERNVGGADVNVDSQYNSLRISELRQMAHEKCINVDGSRETLIAALKSVCGVM